MVEGPWPKALFETGNPESGQGPKIAISAVHFTLFISGLCDGFSLTVSSESPFIGGFPELSRSRGIA